MNHVTVRMFGEEVEVETQGMPNRQRGFRGFMRTLPGRIAAAIVLAAALTTIIGFGEVQGWLPRSTVSTPCACPPPTPTPSPTPPIKLLYRANWSQGLNGWFPVGTHQWNTQNGELVSDGTNCCTIIAPFSPSVADYTVTAVVQIQLGTASFRGFSLSGRLQKPYDADSTGYKAGVSYLDANNSGVADISLLSADNPLAQVPFSPGSAAHTYIFVLHGSDLKLFVDRSKEPIVEVHDNSYQFGGQLGLRSGVGTLLTVESFVVTTN